MPVLNDNISLQEFNSAFKLNGRQPRDFFCRHAAVSRDLLPPGTVLWKCTDFGISPSHHVSEWWVLHDHLKEVLRRCENLNVLLQRYCRARYAVIWEWKSAASYLVEARLLQPVYAFGGQTADVDTRYTVRGQDTELKNISLIGGDPQLCIPNLNTSHIVQISQVPSDSLPKLHRPGGTAI